MFKKNFKPFLSKLGEPFLSKLGESIADKALNKLKVVPLETLQKNLKFLRDKACDVVEQIKHAECSGQKKRKREVEEWLEEVKSIETEVIELGSRMESEGFIRRLMDGGKATQLNERVEKLAERSQNFGELVIDRFGTRPEMLLTSRIVGNEYERNLEKILGLIENGEVLSIGIHGMGGVGKTTLAKGIYNRLLQASRGPVFWVTISQELSVNSLQEKIGRCLNVDLSDEKNEDMRAGRLHKTLSKMKNTILILDNMWRNIDLLKVGCPFSKECCRLIMTSRSLDVCHQIGCHEVIAVQKLGEYESWNLFNQTFKLGKDINLSPQVEEIAKYVAKCCDGLPLAIISLAASMRGQTAIHTWRSALEKLKESFAEQDGMREGRVFEVLKYSFDRLNENSQSKDFNSVQLCFLYFSLYPEDEEVERDDLIRAFISDGLLDTRKSGRAQYDQGQVILDKLVNVCLLESVGVKSDCLKMHDLVRGMALKIVGGMYLVRAGELSLTEIPQEDEWTKDVEKVSLMKTDIRRIENGTSPNCPNLSTLIFRESPLEFIQDSFFSKMQGLCNLDLCYTRIRGLPDTLSNLKNLQSLLLTGCYRLEQVPYLGNLKALRELNLSDTAIKEMPEGLNELLNLKFLSLDEAHNLKAFPRVVLPKLVNLQYLRFPFHLEADMDEMENLIQLEEFTGRCRGSSKCLWDDFSRPRNLRILSIEGCGGTEWMWRKEWMISPNSSLEFLALKGLEDFKGLIETPGPPQGMFSSLCTLVIIKCKKMQKLELPAWGFPSLESISIEFCEEIQQIFGRGCVTLPKLKELVLRKLPRLESVCEVAMICNSIEEIVIEGCPILMKKLPVHLDVPLQPMLRKVEVDKEWWESLEWDNPQQLPNLLQSSVCRLHLIDRQL